MTSVIRLSILFLLMCLTKAVTFSNTYKLRNRALEGLSDLRGLSSYRAIKEAAWDEMRQRRYYSALKKLKYHQQLQPRDVEAYYLEGECLTKLERWKDAYIAYHKAYFLTGDRRYQDLMIKTKEKAGKPVVQEKPWYLKIKDPNEKETVSIVKELPKIPVAKQRGSYLQLSRMRMLQSLVDRYQSKYGKIEEFKLDSILKQRVTTRPIDVSELGKVTLVNGLVFSEIYGSVSDIRDSMKFFSEAVALVSSKNTTGAIVLLESNQDKLLLSEAEYLISLYRLQNRINDEITYRETLVEKFPDYYSNLLFLADYYYDKGSNQKALSYYEKIVESKFSNNDLRRRVKQLRAGGTKNLKSLLESQRRELLKKENESK